MNEDRLQSICEGIYIEENGDLAGSAPFMFWYKGWENACLDGNFTAAQLRAIAHYMEKMRAQAARDHVGP